MIQSLNANTTVFSYRPVAAARPVSESGPVDAVSFAPLKSMGGGAVGLKRTGAETASELVKRWFRPDEFLALNSGHYHNAEHPVAVASAVTGLARGYGYGEDRVQFLQQVALLHDADERVGSPEHGPARAQVTLEWMDRNQGELSQRMGWSAVDFKEAKALIARTDFPFDEKPRSYGTRYDGKSPVQVYRELLDELPPERRPAAMKDGVMLSFADQTGFYAGTFEQGAAAVRGLAEELQPFIDTSFADMIKTTPGFLRNAANSVELDWKIADQVGVQNPQLPARTELLEAYPERMRTNLNRNLERFTQIGQALTSFPPDVQDWALEKLLQKK